MKMTRALLMRIFSLALLLAICGLLLPPVPVLADDFELPDFSKLDGKIPGLDIPLSQSNSRGVTSEEDFTSISLTYQDGDFESSNNAFRELRFDIYCHRDASQISQNSVLKNLRTDWGKNPAGTGPLYLEKWREEPGYRDIEVENPDPNRFSLLFYRAPYGWGG
jgi:hypothetical protein